MAIIKLAMGDDGNLLDELRRCQFGATVVELTDGPPSPIAAKWLAGAAMEMPIVLVDAVVATGLFDRGEVAVLVRDVVAPGPDPRGSPLRRQGAAGRRRRRRCRRSSRSHSAGAVGACMSRHFSTAALASARP